MKTSMRHLRPTPRLKTSLRKPRSKIIIIIIINIPRWKCPLRHLRKACKLKTSSDIACVSQKIKKREMKKRIRKKFISYFLTFLLFCKIVHSGRFHGYTPIPTSYHPFLYQYTSYPSSPFILPYLSPSHHQEIQISPPLYDVIGRTCIATRRSCNVIGVYGATWGTSEEEKIPK